MRIEKLIAKFPDDENLAENYVTAKNKYIANYEEYVPSSGSLFFYSPGYYEKRPDIGLAKWNDMYPTPTDYLKLYRLDGQEARDLVNKVNQLIEVVNELEGKQ